MRFKRVLAAGTAFGLLGAVSTVGLADAAAPGVGTSQASTTVLSVQLGDLLGLRVLGDDARATIDHQVADPSAFSKLVGVEVTSKVLPALNLSVPPTSLESRTPGGQPIVSITDLNIASGITGVAVPASIAGGSITASLTSSLDALAARSGINASVTNLNVVGGLLNVSEVTSNLGSGAATQVADGTRTVKVGAVNVLDLGALLNGLGLAISDLPVSTINGLLTSLNVPVAGVPTGMNLSDYVAALNQAIDEVQATVDTQSNTVTGTVDSSVGGLLTSLSLPVPQSGAAVATVQQTINTLQATLGGVIDTALKALDDLTLVKLGGAEVGVITKATDNVKTSVADVVASVGPISIGAVTIPGVNLADAATQINGLVSQVNGTLSSVLGTVSPDLANLVSISVLDQVESVTQDHGYTRARAGITALSASVTPPANLSAIVNTIKGATGAGDVLGSLGQTVPQLSTAMDTLNGVLGTAVNALSSGAVVKVAEVQAASDFAPGSIATPATELPRTGGSTPLAAFALLLAALGLGIRRSMPAITRTK